MAIGIGVGVAVVVVIVVVVIVFVCCKSKYKMCFFVGPMTPYIPLNIAIIHNIDLIPTTPSISSESC